MARRGIAREAREGQQRLTDEVAQRADAAPRRRLAQAVAAGQGAEERAQEVVQVWLEDLTVQEERTKRELQGVRRGRAQWQRAGHASRRVGR